METGELLRIITSLPLISFGLAEEMMSGNFRSVFRGRGIEFDEARHYQAGDDIRSIDWNASARFGYPFVKTYREERELVILILLDVSPSMRRGFFSRCEMSPYEQALISAASIAFSAEHTNQRVGAFFFDRDVEKVFPPLKGRRHIMALVTAALQYQNKEMPRRKGSGGSNIAAALKTARQSLKKRALVVVISDFFGVNWEHEMANLRRKHDCIALRIYDPFDFPYRALITLEDPETGVRIEAPGGLASFREEWSSWHTQRSMQWESQCRHTGASYLELCTEADAPSALIKFFAGHGRRHNSGRRGVWK
ncbi:MAG: DUF58 domain-containing protein [Treponema sp.]|jgi:uncharacterized protein (DUF58 family)|nr:DUF58 domain-containing protein [Treponema sp.]